MRQLPQHIYSRSTFVYVLIILIKWTELFVSVCAYMRVVFYKVNALQHIYTYTQEKKKRPYFCCDEIKKNNFHFVQSLTLARTYARRIYVVSFYVLK